VGLFAPSAAITNRALTTSEAPVRRSVSRTSALSASTRSTAASVPNRTRAWGEPDNTSSSTGSSRSWWTDDIRHGESLGSAACT
jgi:hypothetical protein